VVATLTGGSVRLVPIVTGEAHGMVRRIHVYARAAVDRPFERAAGGPLSIEVGGEEVQYYAEAEGPGNVPILRLASAEEPAVVVVSDLSSESSPWIAFAIALTVGAAVGAGAFALAFLIGSDDDATEVAPFTVRF
jgi:hypothetical protein